MAPEVLAGILPRIYPQMLDEVHRHQDEGRATFIVSAAGNEMVKALAAVLGMEGGIGTRSRSVPTASYTGELDGPFVYGEGKVEAMRRLRRRARDRPRRPPTPTRTRSATCRCCASVGNAVVVNPDAGSCEVARREGWQVMRFEKLGRKLAIAGGDGAGSGGRRGSSRIQAAKQGAHPARAAGPFGAEDRHRLSDPANTVEAGQFSD